MDTPRNELGDTGSGSGDPTSHEQFLLDEGLEVLASYKAIRDAEVRLRVRSLLAAIVAGQPTDG